MKEKIIYEPFKTLEEQEAFEKALQQDIEESISGVEEGSEEDLKIVEEKQEKVDLLQARMEEKLIGLQS